MTHSTPPPPPKRKWLHRAREESPILHAGFARSTAEQMPALVSITQVIRVLLFLKRGCVLPTHFVTSSSFMDTPEGVALRERLGH
jgi:hypothetical protein